MSHDVPIGATQVTLAQLNERSREIFRQIVESYLATGEPADALVERSDVAAVEALAVVTEAAVAFELARAAREKFGGDAMQDVLAAHAAYLERIEWARR